MKKYLAGVLTGMLIVSVTSLLAVHSWLGYSEGNVYIKGVPDAVKSIQLRGGSGDVMIIPSEADSLGNKPLTVSISNQSGEWDFVPNGEYYRVSFNPLNSSEHLTMTDLDGDSVIDVFFDDVGAFYKINDLVALKKKSSQGEDAE